MKAGLRGKGRASQIRVGHRHQRHAHSLMLTLSSLCIIPAGFGAGLQGGQNQPHHTTLISFPLLVEFIGDALHPQMSVS